jgi:hypothetical protein
MLFLFLLSSSMGSMLDKPKITINLMDVSFLEQNLQQILEVTTNIFINKQPALIVALIQLERGAPL